MSAVKIGYVKDYEDPQNIGNFVTEVFALDSSIAEMLESADPSRLVMIKPNWIQQSHDYDPDVWAPLITHPNLIVAVLEFLANRMKGRGTICVGDAPHTHADFGAILERGALGKRIGRLRDRWPDLNIELLDVRREIWIRKENVIVERLPNPEDPRGYVRLNVGRHSLFYRHPGEGRFFGADYDTEKVNSHHHGEVQEYLLSGTAIACDLFINLPKMKTHKKTGITCCLKNLVGITGDKDWLPHFVEGTPRTAGDEFPAMSLSTSIERRLKKAGQRLALRSPGLGGLIFRKVRNMGISVLGDSSKTVRAGNWAGNDTCWRMALDLNRCLLYGNSDGSWRDASRPKRYLAIVDGILGGEGNGPLAPDPVESGVLVGGTNPAAVDSCVSRLMGFDPRDLPIVQNAFSGHPWPLADCALDDIRVEDSRMARPISIGDVKPIIDGGFKPHFGWPRLGQASPDRPAALNRTP